LKIQIPDSLKDEVMVSTQRQPNGVLIDLFWHKRYYYWVHTNSVGKESLTLYINSEDISKSSSPFEEIILTFEDDFERIFVQNGRFLQGLDKEHETVFFLYL
jgi:hypothetical protein